MTSSRSDARHLSAPNRASGPDEVSRLRKIVAWSIRGAGFLLGAALASIYLFLAWELPPDMSNARPRAVLFFYLVGPLLLLCGPMFLAGWIASHIDHRRLTD
jgi:MFS family permease